MVLRLRAPGRTRRATRSAVPLRVAFTVVVRCACVWGPTTRPRCARGETVAYAPGSAAPPGRGVVGAATDTPRAPALTLRPQPQPAGGVLVRPSINTPRRTFRCTIRPRGQGEVGHHHHQHTSLSIGRGARGQAAPGQTAPRDNTLTRSGDRSSTITITRSPAAVYARRSQQGDAMGGCVARACCPYARTRARRPVY